MRPATSPCQLELLVRLVLYNRSNEWSRLLSVLLTEEARELADFRGTRRSLRSLTGDFAYGETPTARARSANYPADADGGPLPRPERILIQTGSAVDPADDPSVQRTTQGGEPSEPRTSTTTAVLISPSFAEGGSTITSSDRTRGRVTTTASHAQHGSVSPRCGRAGGLLVGAVNRAPSSSPPIFAKQGDDFDKRLSTADQQSHPSL